jgi:hypothetical protein
MAKSLVGLPIAICALLTDQPESFTWPIPSNVLAADSQNSANSLK